jgi:hypothetical protein
MPNVIKLVLNIKAYHRIEYSLVEAILVTQANENPN